MLILRWEWPDGEFGYCVGEAESLVTVKFAIRKYWQSIKFSLKDVSTGHNVSCTWIEHWELIESK